MPSVIEDNEIYNAIIWPIPDTDHWWAIGSGFKFTVYKDKIIEYLDESPSKESEWISVNDQLPELMKYVLIYNTEGATLVGRLMSNGWIATFADGERLMGELTATHWRPLPKPPKVNP